MKSRILPWLVFLASLAAILVATLTPYQGEVPATRVCVLCAPSDLAEEKRRVLRALKDLEQEHSLGKIDDRDYAELEAEYRARAKKVIREMDDALGPYRAKAEALVKTHLEKLPKEEAEDDAAPTACPECATKNDPDAAFCKKCGAELT